MWMGAIKMDLEEETRCDFVDWFQMAQDKTYLQAVSEKMRKMFLYESRYEITFHKTI